MRPCSNSGGLQATAASPAARRSGIVRVLVAGGAWITLVAAAAVSACNNGPTPAATPDSPSEPPTPTAIPTPTNEPPTSMIELRRRATFYGADPGDHATGLAVGDFNGDGALDVLLAALGDGPQNERTDGGEAYVFFGPFAPDQALDAAAGGQGVTIYGADDGDQSGRAVAAGDVNGDGIDDIVIGAPFADGPDNGREDAGGADVIYGSAGLPPIIDLAVDQPDVRIYGADPGDLAGFALEVADFNGDGTDDLMISAFQADGPLNDRAEAGEVYLVTGSNDLARTIDLAAGEQDVTITGAEADDWLGETVAAGDLNGDGVDDLVLAANFASGPNNERDAAGEIYVILGSNSLPASFDIAADEPDMTVYGKDPGDQIGHSLATGDVNGDGFDDLLLGAVSADGPENARRLAGEAYLVLGGQPLPETVDAAAGEAALLVYAPDEVDRLGRSVGLGDLDGDGRSDLLLGMPGGDGLQETVENAGEVSILFADGDLAGTIDLSSDAADLTVAGDDPGDELSVEVFGRLPLLAVDMNGDGLADMLVAAANGDGPANERSDAGEAYIIFAERR